RGSTSCGLPDNRLPAWQEDLTKPVHCLLDYHTLDLTVGIPPGSFALPFYSPSSAPFHRCRRGQNLAYTYHQTLSPGAGSLPNRRAQLQSHLESEGLSPGCGANRRCPSNCRSPA